MTLRWSVLNPLHSFILLAGIALSVPCVSQAQGAPSAERMHERGGPPPMPDFHHEHEGPGRGGLPPFLHGADLSEAQRDKIFIIMHNQAPQLREFGKEAQKAHQELRALSSSGKYDEAKAKALADAGARAMAGIALLHARGESQVYDLLTAEQRARIEAAKAAMQSRHRPGGPPKER